jgi:two-component system, OmpR family, response regulator
LNKDLSSIRILVVEDEDDLREAIVRYLVSRSIQVLESVSGRLAYEILMMSVVDLVLSDISMPDGDGVFLLKKIRQNISSTLPVIFMSGYSERTSHKLYDISDIPLLHKPFKPEALLEMICRLTGHA